MAAKKEKPVRTRASRLVGIMGVIRSGRGQAKKKKPAKKR